MDNVRTSYERIAEAYAAGITPVQSKKFDCAQLDLFLGRLPDGPVWDAGCGPGDTTRYLARLRPDVTGLDISAEMIGVASRIDPKGRYLIGDMASIGPETHELAEIVAFYSLIHLPPSEIPPVLRRWCEALRPDGRLLIAVHEGTGTLHLDKMLNEPVDLDFHFFSTGQLTELLTGAGFLVTDITVREPFPEIEAQRRRIYAQAVKP